MTLTNPFDEPGEQEADSPLRAIVREEIARAFAQMALEAERLPSYDTETITDMAAEVVGQVALKLTTDQRCEDCGHFPHYDYRPCGVRIEGPNNRYVHCPCERKTS